MSSHFSTVCVPGGSHLVVVFSAIPNDLSVVAMMIALMLTVGSGELGAGCCFEGSFCY